MNKLILLSLMLLIAVQYITTAPSPGDREARSAETPGTDGTEEEEGTEGDTGADEYDDNRRKKRAPNKYKPSRRTCLPGCSLTNSTGDEVETESCPSGFSCVDGPYNVTIDGDDHQMTSCLSDDDASDSSDSDEDDDIAMSNMEHHACSWDNGTLTLTEDCCDGWSCSSETFLYDYEATNYTFQFCVKDSGDTLNLLRRMACSKIRPCKNA